MRDNFSAATIETLAKRVSYRCSNPNCRRPTSGPSLIKEKSVSIGVAAHISAASNGGKRYDPNITIEQRKSIENAIWLCQNCGKLIDSDEKRFTTKTLIDWKLAAENEAQSFIYGGIVALEPEIDNNLLNTHDILKPYSDLFLRKYGFIRVLGWPKPIELEKIFTPITLVESDFLLDINNPNILQEDFVNTGRSFSFGNKERTNAILVAQQKEFLFIQGWPGSGKSTFLKYFGVSVLRSQISEDKDKNQLLFPIYIELKHIKSTLLKSINQELFKFGIKEKKGNILMSSGNFIFLFDGLDEVDENKSKQIITEINNLTSELNTNKNKFIVTCRSGVGADSFLHLECFTITNFQRNQVKLFIDNWFSDGIAILEKKAEKLYDELLKDENIPILELAQSPLLLALICILYSHKKQLPLNRSDLYKKVLELILYDWSEIKQTGNSKLKNIIDINDEIEFLEEIGKCKFEKNSYFFPSDDILNLIEQFYFKKFNSKTSFKRILAKAKFSSKEILKRIEIEQGIIVKHDNDTYSFCHLTMQEYLTARNIDRNLSHLKGSIERYFFNEKWKEVFKLLSEMNNKELFFKLALSTLNGSYFNSSVLLKLTEWIREFVIIPNLSLNFIALSLALEITEKSILAIDQFGKNIYNSNISIRMKSHYEKFAYRDDYNRVYMREYLNLAKDKSLQIAGQLDSTLNDEIKVVRDQYKKNYNSNESTNMIILFDILELKSKYFKKNYEDWSQLKYSSVGNIRLAVGLPSINEIEKDEIDNIIGFIYGISLLRECKKSIASERYHELLSTFPIDFTKYLI